MKNRTTLLPSFRPRRLGMALRLACLSLAAPLPAQAQVADGIADLGTLGGIFSGASGVSADGSVVVGHAAIASGLGAHAFRWTSSGMTDLGTLGGWSSYATGVSADGSVVVGLSQNFNDWRAFRWTNGGMTDLGTLGGTYSIARGVSADGSAVVGYAQTAGAAQHAFRWILGAAANGTTSFDTTGASGGAMTDLGTLGGTASNAYGVSADGSVVVGQAQTAGNAANHAFRWASGVMTDLGTLGGTESYAYGVSANGSVVVGEANMAGDAAIHAFRWTNNVMTDLGTLGGSWSRAYGVSANGLVAVGQSYLSGDTTTRAFRWTAGTKMQSVEDWLRAAGVAVPVDITAGAYAANSDGSVVVGNLENNHAFIARVAPVGSGLVTLADLSQSLAGTARGGATALSSAGLVLNGAHSRPLARRVAPGQRTFWLAGDWGRDDRGGRNGDLGLAEAGLGRNLGPVQVNLSLGQTWARQDQDLGGHAQTDGTYLLAEALIPVAGPLWAVLGGYGHWGEADLKRGYANAGAQDASTGTPSVNSWGLRARLELDEAYRLAQADFSPYLDLSYSQARLDAYTETGGGFPARFEARTGKATELRLGVDMDRPLGNGLHLVGLLEAAHRFEESGPRTRGDVVGLFGFDLDGAKHQQDWLRAGAGVEGELAGGTASLMLNATSRGEVPSYWLAAGWRMAF